jgi:hypothetical protein
LVSLVTVEFVPDGAATALTLTHERFADEAARDRHHGWTGTLDKFAASAVRPGEGGQSL